jgi:hypothetical protein
VYCSECALSTVDKISACKGKLQAPQCTAQSDLG